MEWHGYFVSIKLTTSQRNIHDSLSEPVAGKFEDTVKDNNANLQATAILSFGATNGRYAFPVGLCLLACCYWLLAAD